MQVLDSSPVVGKTIEEAGMRHLEKMFLVSVERGADNNHAVCSASEKSSRSIPLHLTS
jgi:hypothetical protein